MMPDDAAPRLAQAWADALVDQLVVAGVRHFFIAPGSRSTPLTMAAARHPDAQTTVHFDERGTAFMALGAARATGIPAAWITTSGTAVANGLPAVVEASVDGVPMILLTADRPPELRETGANQTIDQVKIFGDYVRWFFDLPAPTAAIPVDFVRSTAAHAVAASLGVEAGPVHLNCMFREPLVPRLGRSGSEPASGRVYQLASGMLAPTREMVEGVARLVGGAERGMIVAGRLKRRDEALTIEHLARKLAWPLVADIQSQLRLGQSSESPQVGFIDPILASGRVDVPEAPDVILHFGSGIVSKRMSLWMASASSAYRISIRSERSRLDPFHQFDLRMTCDPGAFAFALAEHGPRTLPGGYLESWKALSSRARLRLADAFGEQDELTEPAVAYHLTRLVPDSHTLVAGSSMPIRDLDMFAAPDGAAVPLVANRGASGIDGTIATAIGTCVASGRGVSVLCGDLTMLHDLNSLAAAARVKRPIVVIVVNNDGGGIFSFLPVAKHTQVFEPYFGTPHGLTFEHAAKMFGIGYAAPTDVRSFTDVYRDASQREGATLIEVRTNRERNLEEHRRLYARIGE